jgi:two-component system response regulator DegU
MIYFHPTMRKPITVLVADDHPLFRKGLIDVLRAEPELKVVQEAGDGASALRLLKELRPDVMVLDIEMPQGGGMEVAREMQRLNLPAQIIFITAYKDPETFDEAMNLGVKGYVLKESAVTDIVAGIKTVAAGNRYISPSLSGLLFDRSRAAQTLREKVPGLDALTAGERRILKLVSQDRTSKEIAADLGLSARTVENHRANIAGKLGLSGSHSLLKFAYDNKSKL